MKNIETKIKLQIKAEEANPGPPIGPTLGAKGINIIKFCNEFNIKTKENTELKKGTIVSVIIKVYKNKNFEIFIKSPPASFLIMECLGIKKGSSVPNKKKIGKINIMQLRSIVEKKKTDLFEKNEDAAIKTLIGTAKSMGLEIES